ncbi:MAG: MATE family efflux transporter [Lachnospiraceae bacterium]
MMNTFKKTFIGDKQFYISLLLLTFPIVIQQGVTNLVSLLDNVMVGSLGTESISAVAIVNQLLFVFNITIFGVVSGASIFGAQFAGSHDHKGLRESFRYKIIFGILASILGFLILHFYGEFLISNFLDPASSDATEIALTLSLAKQYLVIMLFSLLPFTFTQTYASTLRELGETLAPMTASVLSLVINLALNYILIFGHFGAPALGVVGAAIGTTIARYAEFLYIFIFTHRNSTRFQFIKGAYHSLHISPKLLKNIFIMGTPLLLNEVLWSVGMTVINQAYSTKGLQVVAGINITNTAWNLFCIIMFAVSTGVSVMVGQHLGAGNIERAKDTDNKLLFAALMLHIGIGIVLFFVAPYIPLLYNTDDTVRELASSLLRVAAFALPIHAVAHIMYFTLRAGGKTIVTFFFDSVYTWLIPVPLIYFLTRYTTLPVVTIYCCIQCIDIIKVFIGIPLIKSGYWAKNVIE